MEIDRAKELINNLSKVASDAVLKQEKTTNKKIPCRHCYLDEELQYNYCHACGRMLI